MSRRRWILAGLVIFFGSAALGASWNAGFEASPAGTDLASDLDTFIQTFKIEVRRRASVENIFGTGTDDNGLNRPGSARAFSQNTTPGSIDGPGQYNAAGGVFAGALLTTDEIGTTVRDIGAGRTWIDVDGATTGIVATDNAATDANILSVWSESANSFRRVTARDQGGAGIGANNLLTNGSFEITDGTGSAASVTVASGWANVNTATIAYVDPTDVSEGEGIAMRTTAAGGAGLEGARQTLNSLKASVTYVFRARVRAAVGSTCTLTVADGTSTVSDVSVADTTFEPLEVQLTTTAVPAAVTVDLLSTADTNVCDWDHVTVFERYASVPQPGIQVCRQVNSVVGVGAYSNAAWATAGVTCAVTPPGPGYLVRVTGKLLADNDSGASGARFMGRMQENGVTVDFGATGSGGTVGEPYTLNLGFSRTNPTPGTTLTYTMDGREGVGATVIDRNIDDAAETFGETTPTWIQVELIPTR